MNSIEKRALSAWLRTGENPQPNSPETVELDGLIYVVLKNRNGVLAVYRYIEQRDQLKKLRRYPKELED